MNKEQMKIQIEDLKANLEALERELNKLEEFKFKYEARSTNYIGSYSINKRRIGDDKDYLSNFRYRQLEVNAEADFQLQKELMCIGALAEQIDPNYKNKVKWLVDNNFYSIQQDMQTGEYQVCHSYPKRRLGVVYMPKYVAEKVCEILNNKEVVF